MQYLNIYLSLYLCNNMEEKNKKLAKKNTQLKSELRSKAIENNKTIEKNIKGNYYNDLTKDKMCLFLDESIQVLEELLNKTKIYKENINKTEEVGKRRKPMKEKNINKK
ncbi:hypothetical protein SLOPH_738 [Spraguea lophii 42_110]|uniref:Uncharacterized protein n=1 Tax=Spraguea lophii (strain 42_110) TaxID=1358809 RepID=S7W9L6_SPRLO|nr:hypothetical protein SLOPH_738 [Spraguea lophii 42_110]